MWNVFGGIRGEIQGLILCFDLFALSERGWHSRAHQGLKPIPTSIRARPYPFPSVKSTACDSMMSA